MKKLLFTSFLCLCASVINAQITIMDEEIQERIVSKPRAFDSLSNITYQKDPVQYKQYIGYKLYCLPVSNKYKCQEKDCSVRIKEFKYKSAREFVLPHNPYAQTDVAKLFGDISKLKGTALTQYKDKEELYEKSFVVSTDIYCAIPKDEQLPNMPRGDVENYLKWNVFTQYDSIQNNYYTILNIEIADHWAANKGQFSSLDDFEGDYDELSVLRFTIKNEKTGEELYWVPECRGLKNSVMFLVPYFEKMQKTYNGQKVVPTRNIERLADINTGEPINIQSGEVWQCYNVTFVNLKDKKFIQPYVFLEKDGAKIMIKFSDFREKCKGIFTEEDNVLHPTFILEQDYNEIVAERKRSAEEKQRLEEERQQQEELALREHNKQIIKKYGNKMGGLICEGKVCLKMTKEMCVEAWGEPLYINSTIVNGLVHEQWVYGWHTYLYFDNNVLTGIQN